MQSESNANTRFIFTSQKQRCSIISRVVHPRKEAKKLDCNCKITKSHRASSPPGISDLDREQSSELQWSQFPIFFPESRVKIKFLMRRELALELRIDSMQKEQSEF